MEQTVDTEFPNSTETIIGQTVDNPIKEEDYKNLQSEFTKSRQNEIDLAIKLANKDKSEILNIKDVKIQNKVIKELYNLNNLEEVKLIHGDNFYKESSDEDDEDEMTSMKKKLKLLEFNQTKADIENGIEDFKKENKDLFLSADAEQKLREELKYISSELNSKERIKRASRIAFGISPTDAAYLSLIQTSGTGGNKPTEEGKTKINIEDEINKIFKIKKK